LFVSTQSPTHFEWLLLFCKALLSSVVCTCRFIPKIIVNSLFFSNAYGIREDKRIIILTLTIRLNNFYFLYQYYLPLIILLYIKFVVFNIIVFCEKNKKIERHLYSYFLNFNHHLDCLAAFLIKLYGLYKISYPKNSLRMKHYLNFIFLIIHLVLVQSEDPDLNNFYRKLLTMTTTNNRWNFRSTSSFITKNKLYPQTFGEQFYSKMQISTSTIAIYYRREECLDYRGNIF
jgi:hypothetical protein